MAATTLLKHGVTWSDVPTSVISPIKASTGINFVVGKAPVHLVDAPIVNRPRLYNTYGAFVAEMGYSDDWKNFTLCEHAYSSFVLFGVGPVIYQNVLDPVRHRSQKTDVALTIDENREALIPEPEAIISTLVVQDADGETTFVRGDDYDAFVTDDGQVRIRIYSGGNIPPGTTALSVSYSVIEPGQVTKADIIGGIQLTTGLRLGLEAIEEVFPLFRVVPGIILAPGYSTDPEVAAVMVAKCESINGAFKARCGIDADTETVRKAVDVPNWKNRNNVVFERQDCLWPKIGLSDRVFNYSSQWGPLQMHTDITRGRDIPYYSASNKNLRMNKTILADGSEIIIPKPDADYMNSQGIVSVSNFIGGFRAWGNRTAIYPASSDVKDVFHSVRRTHDYVGNTVVLTIWQKVDEPMNRRLIDSVVNSLQRWMNGLEAVGATLGARVEFRHDENPTVELLAGHMVFRLFIAPPPPAEWIEFLIEFDVNYLSNLFA
jgi:uncharacterized protein